MRKRRVFLNFPEFPGGKEEFRKYVKANLRYPDEALERKIEGTVYLSAQVDDEGHVRDVHIERGLGSGCDEEAVRLVSGVQFGSVHNRGLRVKTRKKFRIEFKIAGRRKQQKSQVKTEINYSYKEKKVSETDKGDSAVYGYTLQLRISDAGRTST